MKDLTLILRAFDLYTRQFVQYENASRQVSLLAGQNMELGTLTNPSEVKANSLIILSAFLVDSEEAVLARFIDWPEPFHYLNWPKAPRLQQRL
ncbi:hypothetical protein DPV78_012797 [Talaromyces pinophilus]|nr:hypothetical protein DPV78_012797 [Talaromyces pinophilus]